MDSYQKLRPWTDIERCNCENVHGLFLIDLLTSNPINCSNCRCEVDPEQLELTSDETEKIARWYSAESALYKLWLDSGEYETYAKTCLIDPLGQVNIDGRAIAKELSKRIPTQLWLFHDTDDGEPENCPICNEPLNLDVKWGTGECRECYIHI